MSESIDPIQFGRLLEAVDNLTGHVGNLTKEVKALDDKIANTRMVFFGSKWFAIGVLLSAGATGAGVSKLAEHLLKASV